MFYLLRIIFGTMLAVLFRDISEDPFERPIVRTEISRSAYTKTEREAYWAAKLQQTKKEARELLERTGWEETRKKLQKQQTPQPIPFPEDGKKFTMSFGTPRQESVSPTGNVTGNRSAETASRDSSSATKSSGQQMHFVTGMASLIMTTSMNSTSGSSSYESSHSHHHDAPSSTHHHHS